MSFLRTLVLAGGLIVALAAVSVDSAWAQFRTLPANAKRAELTGYSNPFVILNGEQLRLAPGAVIFDKSNRMILPGYLPEQADVVYTIENTSGLVLRIYILTPEEQRRLNDAKR
jgi:hypothetical protein